MIIIDLYSRTPIYEQIKEQIIELINKGVYKPLDKLPSIRTMAADLELNVNTVKRAFQDLEAEGVVYSLQGRGVFVSDNAVNNEGVKAKAAESLTAAIASAKAKGLTKDEIIALAEKIFEEGDNHD